MVYIIRFEQVIYWNSNPHKARPAQISSMVGGSQQDFHLSCGGERESEVLFFYVVIKVQKKLIDEKVVAIRANNVGNTSVWAPTTQTDE